MGAMIVFKSVTYAQKSQKLLEKSGVLCSLSKVSAQFGMGSCAHCLKFNEKYLSQVTNLIQSKNIPFIGVYKSIEKDRWQQVRV